MKNEQRLPTTLTGFMALMDTDGDLPLGVIQALLDQVAALTAENARLVSRLLQIVSLYKDAREHLGGDSELLRDAILGGAVFDLRFSAI